MLPPDPMLCGAEPAGNSATATAGECSPSFATLSDNQRTDLERWYRRCERRALSIAMKKIGDSDAADIYHSAVLRLIEATTRRDDPRAWPATDEEGCAMLLTLVRNGTRDTAKRSTWREPPEHHEAPRHSFWQRPDVVLPPPRHRGDRPLWLAFDDLRVDEARDAAGDAHVAFSGRDLGVTDDEDARRTAHDARLRTRYGKDIEALEAEDRRRCEILAYRMDALKFLMLHQLLKLPEQQHYVVAWSFLRRMKRHAIARLLEITEKTYDNHRRQGLAALRDALRHKHYQQATVDERYWLRIAAWMHRRWARRKEWERRQADRQRRIRRGEIDPWRGKPVEI